MKIKGQISLMAILCVLVLLVGCSSVKNAPEATKTPIIQELVNGDSPTSSTVSPWGDGSESQVAKIAVKFTPDAYPATTQKLSFFARNPSGKDQLFNLYAYTEVNGTIDDSGELFEVKDQVIPQSMEGQPIFVDLPEKMIKEGSVWIVIEWKEKPLSEKQGQNSFSLVTDGTMDNPDRNFFYTRKGWMAFPDLTDQLSDIVMSLTLAE